ncbi:MAG: hypothetical protein ACI8S6_005470 [Myxococcota bacterium]|jgi:hypothetical protein
MNIIDMETGWKVDLTVCKRRPSSKTEFDRRRSEAVLGVALMVCSPEDSILSKLEWAKKSGGSERQRAVGVGRRAARLLVERGVWCCGGGLVPRRVVGHLCR